MSRSNPNFWTDWGSRPRPTPTPRSLLRRALVIARGIDDSALRAIATAALASRLSAMESDHSSRSTNRTSVNLPETAQRDMSLADRVAWLVDKRFTGRALEEAWVAGKRFSGPALEAALDIKDLAMRVRVIVDLVPRLPATEQDIALHEASVAAKQSQRQIRGPKHCVRSPPS